MKSCIPLLRTIRPCYFERDFEYWTPCRHATKIKMSCQFFFVACPSGQKFKVKFQINMFEVTIHCRVIAKYSPMLYSFLCYLHWLFIILCYLHRLFIILCYLHRLFINWPLNFWSKDKKQTWTQRWWNSSKLVPF